VCSEVSALSQSRYALVDAPLSRSVPRPLRCQQPEVAGRSRPGGPIVAHRTRRVRQVWRAAVRHPVERRLLVASLLIAGQLARGRWSRRRRTPPQTRRLPLPQTCRGRAWCRARPRMA
jgi:hypothetical protein